MASHKPFQENRLSRAADNSEPSSFSPLLSPWIFRLASKGTHIPSLDQWNWCAVQVPSLPSAELALCCPVHIPCEASLEQKAVIRGKHSLPSTSELHLISINSASIIGQGHNNDVGNGTTESDFSDSHKETVQGRNPCLGWTLLFSPCHRWLRTFALGIVWNIPFQLLPLVPTKELHLLSYMTSLLLKI